MRIGFVGAGNMAAAMARGWSAADAGPEEISFLDVDREKAEALAEEVGGAVADDGPALVGGSDLVVLAVKPAALDEVADELRPAEPRALLSMLAATPLARIEAAFPGVPAVRVMPNQPVEVRRGVLCYTRGADVSEELADEVERLLGMLGTAIELPEHKMEAAMAVMSCSPAYVAMVAEVLTEAGVREGLGSEEAALFVRETLAGTGELLASRDAASIRRSVAPPGGATEAGLEALERAELRAAFDDAVEASLARFR